MNCLSRILAAVFAALLLSHTATATTLPDAVLTNEAGSNSFGIYVTNLYWKNISSFVRFQKDVAIHFDASSFNPTLVYFNPIQTGSELHKEPILVMMPGDSVKVKYNARQNTFIFTGNHQAELDFCKSIWQGQLCLGGLYFEMTVPASNVPIEEFMLKWQRLKQQGDSLLTALSSTKGIRPEVAAFLARQIRLRVFSILTLPAAYQKENAPLRVFTQAYDDSIAVHAKILKELQYMPASSSEGIGPALIHYLRYKCVSQGEYPDLTAQYNIAKQKYSGFQKAWVCYAILYSKGISNNKDISKLLLDYQSWAQPYGEFIQALKGHEDVSLPSYRGKVFAEELLGIDAKNYQLTDILNRQKGRVILIDLWASWCAPCIAEMPASISASQKYKNKGLVVLYLSIDNDQLKWTQASKKLPKDAKHFRFVDPPASSFLSQFEVSAIPRYVLVDRNGIVRYPDAPRPSAPEFNEIVEKLLSF